MADLNKLRQTKEYQNTKGYEDNEELNKYYDETWNKQMAEIDKQEVDSSTDIEATKSMIVDKITRQFRDILFETVCEEMMDHPVFQSMTYLTEEGYDQFEDEWFEFYHEHHGDILHEVTQNITN